MEYTPIEMFEEKMKERIVKVWWSRRSRRWKYGMVKPHGADVVVCLKGGKIRDLIKGEEIAEYNLKHKIMGTGGIQ